MIRAEGDKKIPELRRLRAKILVGRLDLGAEMRSRVPWPARIVQDAARERDKVGVASPQNGFCLLEFGDQPNGDDWHSCCGFDRTSERNLVSRPHRNLLVGGGCLRTSVGISNCGGS